VEKILSENPPENIRNPLRGVLKNGRNLLGLKMQIEISHGDIASYTKSLVDQFEPLAASKQIELIFESENQVWKTYFDKEKWAKIVSNLISNAIKFTPVNGNVNIYLKNIQKNKKDIIKLIVEDTGQGISSEYLPKIFDRFYRSNGHSHTVSGTGIGLALVKELIDLQDGEITVESEPEAGTTFMVMLPVSDEAMAVSYEDALPSLIELGLTNNELNALDEIEPHQENKLELLIVEDNAEMRNFIRSCVEKNTYNISEAIDGEEGIQKTLETVPDLIISDVMMPKVDGYGLVQAIRENLATSHIPLILLTAKASLESRMEGFERGADAFMSKPFSPDELKMVFKKKMNLLIRSEHISLKIFQYITLPAKLSVINLV